MKNVVGTIGKILSVKNLKEPVHRNSRLSNRVNDF